MNRREFEALMAAAINPMPGQKSPIKGVRLTQADAQLMAPLNLLIQQKGERNISPPSPEEIPPCF